MECIPSLSLSLLCACAGLIVMVVLLCLTPLFRNMPQNAQAAIIISAVAGLFNISEAIFLWKVGTRVQACVCLRASGKRVMWLALWWVLSLQCPTSSGVACKQLLVVSCTP